MGGHGKSPLDLISKLLINPNSESRNYRFYFLLFALAVSVAVVSTLCFRSSSLQELPPAAAAFTILSPQLGKIALSTPPPPLSPSPPPPPQPVVSGYNLTSNNRSTHDDHFKNGYNSSMISLKDPPGISLMHNMTDGELLWKASHMVIPRTEGEAPFSYKFVRKVAFMFLTSGPLPLSPLWEMFFRGHDQALYSIYVHPHPSYNDSWPENSVFYRRRIPSKAVSWGSITMVDAERRLVANALLDISNQRFVLLSDSCIPVFNFTTVYHYLINSKLSFLHVFDDPTRIGRGRYNRRMWPNITIAQWRKGSQWFEVHRDLAVVFVSDTKYYDIFRQYCHPSCFTDEHYLPTLAHILYPEMSTNRSVTWVDWSRGLGAHPWKYGRTDATEKLLDNIRNRSNCHYNGDKKAICFLFARKFSPDSIQSLLRVAPRVMGLVS